ncbi:hypothetical protein ABW21_db0207296 [Orbilia brochopaga]|nr:hypothetical protein ABW21_db0207296 [Drechslerella brochopaga]
MMRSASLVGRLASAVASVFGFDAPSFLLAAAKTFTGFFGAIFIESLTGAGAVAGGAAVELLCSAGLSFVVSSAVFPSALLSDGGDFVALSFSSLFAAAPPRFNLIFCSGSRLVRPFSASSSPSDSFRAFSAFARSICSRMSRCSRSSSPRSCLSFFRIASCRASASGLRST